MSGMCDRLRKSAIWRKGELARSLSTNTPPWRKCCAAVRRADHL